MRSVLKIDLVDDMCTNGQFRILGNTTVNITSGDDLFLGFLGLLEICVNGTYLNICGNDSVSMIDENVDDIICSQLGLTGKYLSGSLKYIYKMK